MSFSNNYKPTVSVIIPTCNRPKVLGRAIESVLKQTYENIVEIIITDDEPTYETRQVVENFQKKDSRIKYVQNTKYRKGAAGNKNNGIDHATGDFIAILDDDDELNPKAISILIEALIKYGYNWVFTDCFDVNKNEFACVHYDEIKVMRYEDALCGNFYGNYFGIIKKEIIGNRRMEDELYGGEGLFVLELFRNNYALYIPSSAKEPLYLQYTEHEYTSKRATNVMFKDHLPKLAEYHKRLIERFGEDIKRICPKQLLRYSMPCALYCKLSGQYKEAIKYSLLSFKVKGLFPLKVLFILFILLPLPIPPRLVLFLKNSLADKGFGAQIKKSLIVAHCSMPLKKRGKEP